MLALLLGGCGEALVRKIHVEGVESVRYYGATGLDLTLHIDNQSRRTVRIEAAELNFFSGTDSLGCAELRGEVMIPKRSSGAVCSRWKFDFRDLASGFLLQKRLLGGELYRLEVAATLTVRVGGFRRRIVCEKMPLSDFLNIFGAMFRDTKDEIEE